MKSIKMNYVLSQKEINLISKSCFYEHEDKKIIKNTFKSLAKM